MERVGAPNIGYRNEALSFSLTNGLQVVNEFLINSTADIADIASHVPSGTVGGVPPFRFILEETMDQFHMSNGTSATIEVDIYDIFPKRDIVASSEYSPPGLGSNPAYPLFQGASSYWTAGALSQASLPATTQPTPDQYYSASPMDSRLLQNYFRIAKRTRVFLPQGASHKHTVLRHVNTLIDATEFSLEAVGSNKPVFSQYRAFTSQILIVIRGTPCATVPAEGASPVVSTTTPLINVVRTRRSKWSYVQDQAYNNYYANNLVAGTQTNINPATGTVLPLAVLPV